MKPNTFQMIWKKPFTNASDLTDLLFDAAVDCGVSCEEINVDACSDGDHCEEITSNLAVLEAEVLSDGSIVYNVTLH